MTIGCVADGGLSPRVRGSRLGQQPHEGRPGSIPACAGEPDRDLLGLRQRQVYPRVCGGAAPPNPTTSHQPGLSPRVRGSPGVRAHAVLRARSIPACAGEPSLPAPSRRRSRVYPRVCGGADDGIAGASPDGGLSPRVRGSLERRDQRTRRSGSIPACAGEPRGRRTGRSLTRVYPRVCGGARIGPVRVYLKQGLSPRVRGSPEQMQLLDHVAGSIPACAGEPWSQRQPSRARGVYPRVCGGASSVVRGVTASTGLSPRVRGSPDADHAGDVGQGSIPACAGEPRTRPAYWRSSRVYPRVCGGALALAGGQPADQGLSPRVRGSPGIGGFARQWTGSIPACAGEPRAATRPCCPWRVYPRVCGGAGAIHFAEIDVTGLSPRVRGSPGLPERVVVEVRSIPACAGEPWSSPRKMQVPRVYPPRVRGSRMAEGSRMVPIGSIPACAGEPRKAPPGWITRRVYPRVCGGAPGRGRAARLAWGLSPRVRGSLEEAAGRTVARRSIPACAGEPSPCDIDARCFQVYPRVCGGAAGFQCRPPTRAVAEVRALQGRRGRGHATSQRTAQARQGHVGGRCVPHWTAPAGCRRHGGCGCRRTPCG